MKLPVAKICGLTRVEDVRLAAGLGAWAVGFVFAPSPRRVTPADARRLAGEARAVRGPESSGPSLAIGVFGDVGADEVVATVIQARLDGVQLHGRSGPGAAAVRAAETARAAAAVRQEEGAGARLLPLLIIQAIAVPPEGCDPGALARDAASARDEGADLILLDTGTTAAFGGTGTGFPWEVARDAAGAGALLVAGGIGPDNVEQVLEHSLAGGVDVSSGVEISPGVKDDRLMRLLFERLTAIGERSSQPGEATCTWPPPPRPQGRAAASHA
jgi:phosphoribosylanthranilate isomerase